MLARLKMLLGIGPAETYEPLSPKARNGLLVADVILVIGLIVVDSVALRVVAVVLMILVTLAVVWFQGRS